MTHRLLALWLVLAAATVASAQSAGEVRTHGDDDLCHVYVVDVLKARRAQEQYERVGPERGTRALEAAQVVFPEFPTVVGEEELTTKAYRFPGSHLFFITASVFYTDESMASAAGADSIMLAVAVTRRPRRHAFEVDNNAVAELTSTGSDTARVKKHVRIDGRPYLLGMECRRASAGRKGDEP